MRSRDLPVVTVAAVLVEVARGRPADAGVFAGLRRQRACVELDGEARATLASEAVVCPHLIDAEVVHALRSQVLRGDLEEPIAAQAIDVWSRLGLDRVGVSGLLTCAWELRENLSAYGATYVALAQAVEAPLVTADGRLGRAPGPRCTITVVRR